VRQPAVAGVFYPAQAAALRDTVADLLAQSPDSPPRPYRAEQVRALIVPHAGYRFSGACAARAYALLRPLRGTITRLVLVGPSHRFAFRGIAQCSYQAYQSPLGLLPVDDVARQMLADLPEVVSEDRAHGDEHALEVHLPFIQETLGMVSLVPLVVGGVSQAALVRVLAALVDDPGTFVLISSDLSHFLSETQAHALDHKTTEAIVHLETSFLADENSACGRAPIAALLQVAIQRGWQAETLMTCTSAPVNGDAQRVVGYGAWAFWQPSAQQAEDHAEAILSAHGAAMEQAARRSIEQGFAGRRAISVQAAALPSALRAPGACFVTLYQEGRLRGCVGSLRAWRRLDDDLVENAYKAAFADRRFPPVTVKDWPSIALSITLLTPAQPLVLTSRADLLARLRPGVDGLILQEGAARAIFLPMVWEHLPSAEEFLAHLLLKAGLAADHWSPELRAFCFTSRSWGGPEGSEKNR
jgi:AmmeMemoRadiSam system protein B/AmmeMemoRadiSam system protein A